MCTLAHVSTPTPDDGRLGRLGRFCARRHWWVIGAWLVVLVGVAVLGRGLGGQANDTVSLPGVRSAEGLAVVQEAFPTQGAAQGVVVLYSPTGPLNSPRVAAAIVAGHAALAKVPGVLSVGTVIPSPDGHIAQVPVEWSTPPQ